ncbi:MAG TPA: acetyl-CoA hydrolase/transferase C-terminal domain-containing protein [Acidimicrobiales bacterium]|nr:acetyl-CoA hydrolase/transferase C-terminal domain-containing protein [Acidimicrobiales bacterium]
MERLDASTAAARIHTTDSFGMPLGPGQPVQLLTEMGTREDWVELNVYGALLTVFTDLFNHPNVHYLSGFFGPLDRALRDAGANVGFSPADFRRFGPLLRYFAPRVMSTAACPPDADGWCSLSLHAGASVDELHLAGADPDRLLVVEVSPNFPRTMGLGEHRHALHIDEIDILIESEASPVTLDDPPPSETDRAIADHAAQFIPDGATLQTGIGAVPSVIATLLADGDGGGYGVHSEMFTDGLMRLHQAGKVVNQKGIYDGHSITTFCAGSAELYDWLDGNTEVRFLPVEYVNSPEVIGKNPKMITINGALSVDIQGQVVADTIGGGQYSGIGGHEDFVAGAAFDLDDRSLICLPSTAIRGGKTVSRLVPGFEAGTVITTPRHHVDIIVTEYGAAELQGRTVHQRGMALAEIAHPDFRDELAAAAERATGGRSPLR